MTQESRIENLEAVVGRQPDGPGPDLILQWPEDETAETLKAQAEVRAWYREHGGAGAVDVVLVDWGDGGDGDPLDQGQGDRDKS